MEVGGRALFLSGVALGVFIASEDEWGTPFAP